ncbi:MAG: DNA-directed RNA polymerase subunit omega [Saprospiraceae bacterium]
MSDIKNKAQGIDPNAKARNVNEIAAKSSNIYESLAIISKRSNQLSVQLKKELQSKLEEFSSATDALEEINENKEQIEISKFYERLPNPSVLALNEFMNDEIETRYKNQEDSEA